jgi:hypothetical protein
MHPYPDETTMQSRQAGSALIVGLIMLVLMMMLAVTSINMGRSGAIIVGNQQQVNLAVAAANTAIEDAISTTRMFEAPDAVYLVACNGNKNAKCVDIDGDSKADITVALTPSPHCVHATAIMNSTLDLNNPKQFPCVLGVSQNPGVAGGMSDASLCSNSLWDIHAVATDNVTQTQTTVNEGTNVQVPTDSVSTTCPSV